MFQNIAAKISYLLLYYVAMLCAVCQSIAIKFSFSLFFLFCYAMCYVSKHSSQNFIFFGFLYFAMLCAMF